MFAVRGSKNTFGMKNLNKVITAIIFLCIATNAISNDLQFKTITPEGGLIYEGIKQITRDKTGRLWCSSKKGLFSYDGKEIKHFTNDTNDSTSLSSNSINFIKFDHLDNLWIATDAGLDMFDPTTNSFQHRFLNSNSQGKTSKFLSLDIDKHNTVWIVNNNRLGKLNLELNIIEYSELPFEDEPTRIYFDKWKRGWVTLKNGAIYRFFPEDKKLVKVVEPKFQNITAFHVEQDLIYIGYTRSIRTYNFKGEIIHEYTNVTSNGKKINLYRIKAIDVDLDGNIWAGGYYGLVKITPNGQTSFYNQSNHSGLPHNAIHSVYIDRENAVWVGTWSGGIALRHPSDIRLEHYTFTNYPGSITSNVVTTFCENQDGSIYVGTETGGLNRFNPSLKMFEQVSLSDKSNPVNIKSLAVDKKGGIWVGTHVYGLFYKPSETNKYIRFSNDQTANRKINGNDVYGLHADKSGVWINAIGKGINYYSLESNQIENFNPIFKTQQIKGYLNSTASFKDSNGNLWVNRAQGCIKINLKDTSVVEFNTKAPLKYQIPDNTVYCITEMSNGDIWLGMEASGIRIYSPHTDSIRKLDLDYNLEKNDVYGIIEDENKNIWVTTSKGLVIIKYSTEQFKSVTTVDNINIGRFLFRSIFKDSQNYFYFGGTNGFIRLKPQDLKTNHTRPVSHISNILINNIKSTAISPKDTSSIPNYNTLHLKADENTLQIDHYSSNLLQPKKNKYKYRLKNFSDNWVEIGYTDKAIFTKIPSGNYTFEILTCNNDGIWQIVPTQLHIQIAYPWYRSHLAYAIYGILLLSVIIIIYMIQKGRYMLKQKVMLEKMKRQNNERMHALKLRFFTNISHEFRTPLTLIAGPVKELAKSDGLSKQQNKFVEIIHNNANRMLDLIEQLMDFQKDEEQKEELNIIHIELLSFLKERYENFSEEANLKNIEYSFKSNNQALYIDADPKKLDKIIYNLLSNAFKYVSPNGSVRFLVEESSDNLTKDYDNIFKIGVPKGDKYIAISIENSGAGIEENELKDIFNRFKQGESSKNGSGIGLYLVKEFTSLHQGQVIAKSSLNKGSCFTILLPIKQVATNIIRENNEPPQQLPQAIESISTIDMSLAHTDNITILIVEDNPEMLAFIDSSLNGYYNTILSPNGDDALKKLNVHDIDIIVSDVMMPEVDGFSFCKTVKSNLSTSHIPVVLITALSSKENKLQGLQHGADAYLIKPFDKEILINQIENLIQQRIKLKEKYRGLVSTDTDATVVLSPEFDNTEQFFLAKAKDIIQKNIQNENFSVELLASELALSRSQLHRKLKQLTNYSASDLIRTHKLNKAAELLKNTDKPISEISFLTGFETHSWFSKTFKEAYNMSPNQYRNKMKQKKDA